MPSREAELEAVAAGGELRPLFRLAWPVIIAELEVTGLDSLEGGERLAERMREMENGVYDRVRLQGLVDSIIEQLHDRGYADAQSFCDCEHGSVRVGGQILRAPASRARLKV